MATYFARKAGNINASDVWATTPSGTAAAVTFADGDVLMANNFAITVNVDINLGATGEVRNDNANSATAGGSFVLNNGITLTANAFAGSTNTRCVGFNGTAGNSASLVGNCTGGTGASITGSCVEFSTSGTFNITGNVTGGAGGLSSGAANRGTGTLNITGNCIGDAAAGAQNTWTGTLNITGTCTGGSAGGGALNTSTGTMLVDGVIQASEFTPGVGGTNRQQVTLLTGPFLISPTFGVNPIANVAWRWASALNNQTYIEVGTQTLLQKRNLVTPDNATNFPAASDVRSGTAYGIGGVVSGTCAVPDPAAVALGVPVSDTVGTLASQTAEQIATAVWSAATRTITGGTVDTATTLTNSPDVPTEAEISAAVWGAATKEITGGTVTNLTNAPASVTPADIWTYGTREITGGTVTNLTNAPSVPSASAIADEVRLELAPELSNLDASVSSRLASADYTEPTSAPSASSVASAVRTELGTELGRIDQNISSRLAAADYTTPPTTAQIATAVEGSLLDENDGQAVLNALVGAIGNQNVDEIALVAAIRSDLERNGGKLDSIPTDAAPSAASVATAVWSASTKEITGGVVDTLTNSPDVPTEAEIATAVWGASTKEITGGTVTNLTNAPASVTPADIWDYNARTLTSASGPTAVEIRQEIDANSSKLDVAISSRLADADYVEPANSDVAAIKVKTDALPSDPADQSLLEAAIAGVTAPSAATVASAVRSELSSELSKVSALNTERLANVATTAIVGNLIAQANS